MAMHVGRALRCRLARRGLAFVLARPEESIGQKLTHTRTVRFGERVPGIVLRFPYGLGQLEAVGDERSDRGSERAAGAVIAPGEPLPGIAAHNPAPVVERVHNL